MVVSGFDLGTRVALALKPGPEPTASDGPAALFGPGSRKMVAAVRGDAKERAVRSIGSAGGDRGSDRVGPNQWSDGELAALTADERSDLLRRLAALNTAAIVDTGRDRRARVGVDFLLLCSIGLIPWIIALALLLPSRYTTHHWTLAWVGFDVALLAGILATAWAGWRRRQVVILTAVITGTLLVTDAWFDIVTSATRRDLLISVATALVAELPMAVIMFHIAHRELRLTTRKARALAGEAVLDPALWRIPVLLIDEPASPPSR